MELAIIGAGMAGLAAARKLRQIRPDLTITVYEQSHSYGGRVATRRREGYSFDHGAQLFKAPSPELQHLIQEELPAAGLRDIGRPVWVFDGTGTIAEGDPELNREPKWIYGDGNDHLGGMLAAGQDVRLQAQIGHLEQHSTGGFRLFDATGQQLGMADMVLLTPPAAQSAEILARSAIDPQTQAALIDELGKADYRRCLSLTMAYDSPLERPFYALVNIDRAHPIAWLALEHAKGAERCPAGQALLTAQMGATWSLEHWDALPEQLVTAAAERVSSLLGEDLRHPRWGDLQRWQFALPDSFADFKTLNSTQSGIYCAGDFCAGLGRVHLAIEQGWCAADLIAHDIRVER